MTREHTGDYCAMSIIYCPAAPPPLVRDLDADHEVMLDGARAAREQYAAAHADDAPATPATVLDWADHRAAVEQILGAGMSFTEGVGFAHQVSKGAHQVQMFAAPIMDDLRPFGAPEPFYDRFGGAAFSMDTDPEKAKLRKPLICRLCLKPVRTLTLKHTARWNACGTNQPEEIPVPMPAPLIPGAEAMPGMLASSGAPMPPLPFANQMPQSVTPAQAPAQTPMPSAAAPAQVAFPPAPSGNPAFPTSSPGGGIPCRIGLGDGSGLVMGTPLAGTK